MPSTLETARRILELAETMRTTDEILLAYWGASRERDRIMASGWPEEAARELVQLRKLEEWIRKDEPAYYGRYASTLVPSTTAAS